MRYKHLDNFEMIKMMNAQENRNHDQKQSPTIWTKDKDQNTFGSTSTSGPVMGDQPTENSEKEPRLLVKICGAPSPSLDAGCILRLLQPGKKNQNGHYFGIYLKLKKSEQDQKFACHSFILAIPMEDKFVGIEWEITGGGSSLCKDLESLYVIKGDDKLSVWDAITRESSDTNVFVPALEEGQEIEFPSSRVSLKGPFPQSDDQSADKLKINAEMELDDFKIKSNETSGFLRLHLLLMREGALPYPINWSFSLGGISDEKADFNYFDITDTQLLFFFESQKSPMEMSLPIFGTKGLEGTMSLELPGFSKRVQMKATLEAKMSGSIAIDLGSPLARLEIKATDATDAIKATLDTDLGFTLDLPKEFQSSLSLDIFKKMIDHNDVINNAWSDGGDKAWLMAINKSVSKEGFQIKWNSNHLVFKRALLEEIISGATVEVNDKRQLIALNGKVLASSKATKVTFYSGTKIEIGNRFQSNCLNSQNQDVSKKYLAIDLGANVKWNEDYLIFKAKGTFYFEFDQEDDNILLKPGTFSCVEEVLLIVEEKQDTTFSDLISLHIPQGTAFAFTNEPANPAFRLCSHQADEASPIILSIPADPEKGQSKGQFKFDINEFSIQSSGFSLKGNVRAESVTLGVTGLEGAIQVKGMNQGGNKVKDQRRIGEIEFKDSKLVYGRIMATAKLGFFDDAVGNLDLMISQEDESGLQCIGSLELADVVEFHVAALFATFQINHPTLSIRYKDKSWEAKGNMSGMIRFEPPAGHSASEAGALSQLFQGLSFQFSDLDPVKLTGGNVSVSFLEPKKFGFADIMIVELKGITIENNKNFLLLGSISIKQLPGVDSSLTLDGIELKGDPISFKVKKIYAELTVSDAFKMNGFLEFFEEKERGFGGQFAVDCGFLPKANVLLKLTSIKAKDGSVVPSMVVYAETSIDRAEPLVDNIYLRGIGLGLGLRQSLRGLEPDNPKSLPDRVHDLIMDPAGLPEPRYLSSWKPVPPESADSPLFWMLVASAQMTFSYFKRNEPHLLAGTILLALSQERIVMAGAKIWLLSSPDDIQTPVFASNPAGQAAIMISLKEQSIAAEFKTKKGSEMTQKIPLIKEILDLVEISAKLRADRHGFMLNIGYPHEIKVNYKIFGGIEAELATGFMFANYRGITLISMNMRTSLKVGAALSITAGPATASLTANAELSCSASFDGVLDSQMRPYLYADMEIKGSMEINAGVSLLIKFGRGRFSIKKNISLGSVTIKDEIGAFLAAAMNHEGKFGYFGIIPLKIPACGHNFYPSIPIGDGKDLVNDVKKEIESHKKSLENSVTLRSSSKGLIGLQAAEERLPTAKESPSLWRYYWFRYEQNNKKFVRVLIFPVAGKAYPKPETKTDERFILKLKPLARFIGFAGLEKEIKSDNSNLKWSENLEEVIVTREDLLPEMERLRSRLIELGIPEPTAFSEAIDYKLRELLNNISHKDKEITKEKEIIDRRVKNPIFSDFDDEYRELATDGFRSPHFSAESEYDRRLKEACSNENCGRESPFAIWKEGDLKKYISSLVNDDMDREMRTHLIDKLNGIGITSCSLGGVTTSLSDAKDLIWTLQLECSIASDLGLLIKYDGKQIQAYLIDYEDGLQSSSIFNELLALLKDTRTLGKDEYLLAKNMRLILEFEDPHDNPDTDPVPDLIDLNEVHTLGGEEKCSLKTNAVGLSYDLIPGWDFQDRNAICLDWDFQREDRPDDPMETFQELEGFVIKRQNLSHPETGVMEEKRQPCWIRGEDGIIFKPRFQFSDYSVKDIEDGDLLQYTIEAVSTDRILATTVFIFERRYLEPLKALGQAVALQPLRGDDIEFTIILNENQEEDKLEDSLRIRFRLASIPSYGSYGFNAGDVSSSHSPELMIEAANDFGSYRPAADLSIPWSETFSLSENSVEWQQIEMDAKIVGYSAKVSWDTILNAVGISLNMKEDAAIGAAKETLRQGKAIEFFVGREIKIESEPMQRSPLSRCRHAVIRSLDAINDDNPMARLNLGNTVSAIELIEPRTGAEFVDPLFICTRAYYGNMQSDVADKPNVMIEIDWRHDSEIRNLFNPVIGYCLHRVDAQDPIRYQQVADGLWYDKPELYVEVVPETFYRRNPGTVVVRKDLSLNAEEVRESSRNNGCLCPDSEGKCPSPAGDWKPIKKEMLSENEGVVSSLADVFPFEKLSGYGPDIYLERGPIWLHTNLKKFIVDLIGKLGESYSCMIVLHSPLLDKPDAEKINDERIPDAFDDFVKEHSLETDPYGWWTAEALGISCECIFLDRDHTPLKAEQIRKALSDLSNVPPIITCFFQKEDRRTLLNVVRMIYPQPIKEWDEEENQNQFFEVLLLQLFGSREENHKLPDEIKKRLEEWRKDLKNRLRSSCAVVDEDAKLIQGITFRQVLRGLTSDGLPSLEMPVASVVLPINSEGVISYSLPVGDNWAHNYSIAIEKIKRYDRIWEMPYVFNWNEIPGKDEGILIDFLREEFGIDSETTVIAKDDKDRIINVAGNISVEINDEKTEVALRVKGNLKDKFISKMENEKLNIYAYSSKTKEKPNLTGKTKEVSVQRTEPLQPDAIMGTPIAGGIQAIVLRNPAAFAASASAINAVMMQFSGQTIFLERRNAEKVDMENIYTNLCEHMRSKAGQKPSLSWALYQKWLQKNQYEDVKPGPSFSSISSSNSGIFKQGETAIFGADRYIIPDLPAYYEYRVAACTNAGLVRSSHAFSAWMQPLWEEGKEEEVQCPKLYSYLSKIGEKEIIYYIRHANYSLKSKILNLKLTLVHYRFHMPKDLRPLWVDSDQTLELSGPEDKFVHLKLGSLPDLHLEYRIYLVVNPGDPTRICLPMLRISPPMAKNDQGSPIGSFEPEYLIKSLNMSNENEKSFGLTQAIEQDTGENELGELQFDIDLNLDGENFRTFSQEIKQSSSPGDDVIDVREFIGVQVSSVRGSSSEIYLPSALKE